MIKPVQKILRKVKKFRKDRKSNRNVLLIFVAIVMIWRGITNLLDIYFLPNHPLISN